MPLDVNNVPYVFVHGDSEKEGWQKELIFKGIFGIETYQVQVKGRAKGVTRPIQKYSYRIYKVKANFCKNCRERYDKGLVDESKDRLKIQSVKSGVLKRCFLGIYGATNNADVTQLFMNWDDVKHFKLLEEEALTEQEVIDRFVEGEIDFISDLGLIVKIENKLGKTL